MGGKISVKSKVKQGSIFLFTVIIKYKGEDTLSHQVVDYNVKSSSSNITLEAPVQEAEIEGRGNGEPKMPDSESISNNKSENPVPKNGKRLLLVEDNDMNRKVDLDHPDWIVWVDVVGRQTAISLLRPEEIFSLGLPHP